MELGKFALILVAMFGATAGTVGDGTVSVQPLTAQYTVKAGDTLTGIAHTLFGRASAWKEIETSNHAIIKDPHFIKPGMVLIYSVEAAQQSLASVLRAKELRKLAGKHPRIHSVKKTPTAKAKSITHLEQKQIVGPMPAPVAKNQRLIRPNIMQMRKPANSENKKTESTSTPAQTLSRLNSYRNLEI